MADQNDPWAAFSPQSTPAPSPSFGSRPVIQQQMTPQDHVQMEHTQLENSSIPLQNQNTQTNIQQGHQSIASSQQQMRLSNANATTGIYKDFISDPVVKGYKEVASRIAAAETARPDGAGDTTVVYGWAKAMDPSGSVREGDTQMAQAASGPMQRAEFLVSQYHLKDGGTLPPSVRTGLIEEMRSAGKKLHEQYLDTYNHFANTAKQNGLDPSILGTDPAKLYVHDEANYIQAQGGTPRNPSTGQPAIDQGQNQAVFNDEKQPRQLSPQQQAAEQAFLATNPSHEQYNAFMFALQGGHDGTPPDQSARLDAIHKGGQYSGAIGQDPRVQQRLDQLKASGTDTGAAFGNGIAQGVTLGGADEIQSFGDAARGSLSGDGAFGDLYGVSHDANQAYQDFLQQTHPIAYDGGAIAGGAVSGAAMPVPATVARAAGEGAALGGTYGFNSGEGGFGNRMGSAAVGAAVGAAVPAALGKVFRPKANQVDPLVDPVTGELNQPMVNSMTPAQRVAVMKDYGMQTITPGMAGGRTARVLEQGLNNVPGSAGVMEDVNTQAAGELRRSMQGVAQQFGQSKTLNESGTQLQKGANKWVDRADSVATKLYNRIPIADTAPSSLANTTATLGELSGRFGSNPDMAAMLNNPKFSAYAQAIQKNGLSWKDLKDFRSLVGNKIGEMRFGENDNTGDFRSLYGALSEDMKNTAAAQGPGALRAFQQANDFYHQKETIVEDALTRILGRDAKARPELAAAAVQTMAQGGKVGGDLRTLAQVKAATVKSGAWDEIASTLIHLGGQPAKSEGRAFSPQTFINWYADMSEPARAMLFKPELRKSLDGFVAMNQQLARIKGLSNTSNTTPTMIGSGAIAAGGIAAVSHPMALVGLVAAGGANYGMAKLWTNPGFVKLITGFGRATATGNANAINSQVGRLSKFAATNPEFSEPVQAILKQISSAANDNIGRAAASPQNDQPNQQ